MEIAPIPTIALPIAATDPSRIGHARRQAMTLAGSMDFSEFSQAQLGIIVTEAANNIAAHASEGEILLTPWHFRGDAGIDILALDHGPGMADVGRSLEDGHSTAGTAGQGLGAIARQAATLQIFSAPGQGTALLARIHRQSPTAESKAAEFNLAAINVPVEGEMRCGDSWSADFSPNRTIYLMADGLGHGPSAADASREAVRVFRSAPHLPIERILGDIHQALAKTRGAAISLVEILHGQGVVNYAGVGNIAASILDQGKSRSMISMNGTMGHSMGRIQTFTYPWSKTSTLIMHSDGLTSRWSLDPYRGLASRHPALIAGVLYRDFCRKRDDVTVLVAKV